MPKLRGIHLVIAGMDVPLNGPSLAPGTTLGAQIGEAITRCSIDLTMDEASQITVVLNDPGHRMLRNDMLPIGGLILWAPSLASPQDFIIATRQATAHDETTIVGRDRIIQRLRNIKGPQMTKAMAPIQALEYFVNGTAQVIGEMTVAGGDLIVPGPVNTDPPGDVWQSAAKWQEDAHAGFVLFSSGGKIFYARPSWLVGRLPTLTLDYLKIDDSIISHIDVYDSMDALDAGKTLSLTVHAELGVLMQPGTVIKLQNHSDDFNGDYWVRQASGDLADDGLWSIEAATPPKDVVWVDPGVGTGTTGGTGGAGGVELPPLGSGITYTDVQIAALLRAAGWPESTLRDMIAVVLAESGGNPFARNVNKDGSVDNGMFQINSKAHPEVTLECARNPQCAVKAALKIAGGGTNLKPWYAYQTKSGAPGPYTKYISRANTAVAILNKPPAKMVASAGPASRSMGSGTHHPAFPFREGGHGDSNVNPALLALRDKFKGNGAYRVDFWPSLAHHQKNPSSDHEKGDGADFMIKSLATGQEIADSIISSESKIDYVIFNHQIWRPGKGWYAYSGDNPHTDHVHVSMFR